MFSVWNSQRQEHVRCDSSRIVLAGDRWPIALTVFKFILLYDSSGRTTARLEERKIKVARALAVFVFFVLLMGCPVARALVVFMFVVLLLG